jgi:CDP-diacylglycerol--serine O-phosphatidyltransferase
MPVTERTALPLRALLPNAITMLALCSGATGVRFAIDGAFDRAAAFVLVAAVLDGLDGRIARLMRGTSRFGAELDSLSDVTAFGLAPAFILYLWALAEFGRLGWVVALFYAVCCALRLARFNASLDRDDLPRKRLGFTTGVPAPAGAAIALAPLFFALGSEGRLDADPLLRGAVAAGVAALAGGLMVSTLPGWSWTSFRVPASARLVVLAGVGLFAAAIAQAPWMTLTLLALLYVAALPFAALRFARLRRAETLMPPAGPEAPPAA